MRSDIPIDNLFDYFGRGVPPLSRLLFYTVFYIYYLITFINQYTFFCKTVYIVSFEAGCIGEEREGETI